VDRAPGSHQKIIYEQLAGQQAKVKRIPLFFLKFVSRFFGFFEWGQNISDRLAFVEI
jgi:hypothetical protein